MSQKNQLLSYAIINLINASVPFLLLPLLTMYLTPSDYGLLSMIQLLMALMLPIVLLNTHGLLVIEYSKLSFKDFQKLVSTIIWIPIAGFILLEIIFFMLKDLIVYYFHIPTQYIFLIPVFVLVQAIPNIIFIIYQAKKELWNFGKYKISLMLVNLLFSLVFVRMYNYGWEGRLWGIIIPFIIFSFVGIIILIQLNLLIFQLDSQFLSNALSFGIPLIPHSIAGVFLVMSDRLFLVNMLGDGAVGIYSVSFQVASVISIMMISINQAWAPNLFERLNNNPTDKDKREIVKQTYKIMIAMMIGVSLFLIFVPFVFDLFIDKSYFQAEFLVKYIALAFLFQGFYFLITNYIFFTKKTYILAYISFFSIFIISINNYFLIQYFGIVGAGYAMLYSWIIFFLLTWFASNKIYPMPWRLS